METEDTVMSPELQTFYKENQLAGLEWQAEISYKAGKQVGINDVVDWLKLHQAESTKEFVVYCMGKEGWQVKLKEWGVE